MLLSKIVQEPCVALMHLERFVNDGSPSGFSRKYTTSPRYSPFTCEDPFPLPLYEFDKTEVVSFGDEAQEASRVLNAGADKVLFPLHPDMQKKLVYELNIEEFDPRLATGFLLALPTASGRTVFCYDYQPRCYLKLHYQGILGRVDRSLNTLKTVAGIEISEAAIDHFKKSPDPSFAFLPEVRGIVRSCHSNRGTEEVGCVVRDAFPSPTLTHALLIPWFSLFSPDNRNPGHPLLLVQLLGNSENAWDTLREKLIRPLLRCYCRMVFELGFIPELNAQNVMVAIDNQCEIKGLVVRDMQGLEKDFGIRRSLGLSCSFQSTPYKCIDPLQDQAYYFIRHSFSYDFKLGEYVFQPLLHCVNKHFHVSEDRMRREVAELFREISGGRDKEHFYPQESWFVHDKILLTGKRPYRELRKPRFRLSH